MILASLFAITHSSEPNLCIQEGNNLISVNISSVMEFQQWWVLKSKLFGQESTSHQGKIFKKFLQVMTVCQKMPKIFKIS